MSLVAQLVKNQLAVEEIQVWSLGWEDPLEKEMMATHSSILAWRIPWTEEPGWLQSMGLQRVRHDWSDLAAAAAATFHCIHTPHLYPFICWWTFRLLPCLDYWQQCCCEHWSASNLDGLLSPHHSHSEQVEAIPLRCLAVPPHGTKSLAGPTFAS